MTLSQTLADFVGKVRHEDLDTADVAAAGAAIADCIGCTVAGARTELGVIVRSVAQRSSADGSSTVIGSARRVSPQAAALANGSAAHALDYDDILWSQYGHPSSAVLSAALATAESTGASGTELVLAYAIGLEVIGKLGRHVNPQHYERGWHATGTLGVIGAAAACSRLLGLDPHRIAMALGVAASESAGIRRNFGTMTKPFHAGDAARGGVLAAELAAEGFTSDLTAFEGEFGWLRNFDARSDPGPSLQQALGAPWELASPGIVLKRYPSCGATHCALDALLGLRAEHGLAAVEIERIECDASPFAKKPLLYSSPRTGLEGKFSMEYCLAVGSVAGQVGLRHFDDRWVADARVRDLIARVDFRTREDLAPGASADAVPAEVSIHARGRVFRRQVRVPSGDPRSPMTREQRRDKFVDCVGPVVDAVALFEMLDRIDQCRDVSRALAPLRGQASQLAVVPA